MFQFLIDKEYRILQKYNPIVKNINIIHKTIQQLSNDQLKQQTKKLKQKLYDGYTLNDLLPEAFATAKEATYRILGLYMFDVQILGGIVLHSGNIAEMKTGEGKTIVSILAAYLNSLQNHGVHIVTVNDYLAKRDYEWISPVYKLLNLTVGLIQEKMTRTERKFNYNKDITFVTNSELGFDYLKDNMSLEQIEVVQKNFHYAIVDEVDSILIDEARTPLIISGPSDIEKIKYVTCNQLVKQLTKETHYEVDEKSKNVTLTDQGLVFCEHFLDINNIYDIENPWAQYIHNALKAKELFIKNQHYIIKNTEIVIVDEFTGRVMEGRRWSDGLHQAIESKENVPIQQENKTLASITYQNLFLLYKKLAGMTGTAKTEETELDKIYNLQVITIPTNRPCIRKDYFDLVYKNEYSKWQAIAQECFHIHKTGRPILVGTTSIDKSEMLSKMLDIYQLKYNLLNAKPENVEREAEIIAQAGKKYALTISTNMAGRGTDIILGGNPKSITKLILINYIKQFNYNNTKYNLENYKLTHDVETTLEQYRSSIKANKALSNITIDNLDNYIHNLIHNYQSNLKNQDIQKLYKKLLVTYTNLFEKEKEEIIKLGGLYVIGTERHESRRIDNQLRGRAGRQGDPGSSKFFLSLDDNLLRIFGGDKIKSLMQNLNIEETIPIESNILSKSLDSAQQKVESHFYDIRKQLFDYDVVINKQRQAIYTERKKILESDFLRDCIIEYAESTIQELLISCKFKKTKPNTQLEQIFHVLNIPIYKYKKYIQKQQIDELQIFLSEQIHITYDLKEAYLENLKPGLIRQLEKYYLLEQIDKAWQDHLEKMSLLKDSITWRSYGQQDPLIEYKNEAFKLFIKMTSYIRQTVVYLIMRSRLIVNFQ